MHQRWCNRGARLNHKMIRVQICHHKTKGWCFALIIQVWRQHRSKPNTKDVIEVNLWEIHIIWKYVEDFKDSHHQKSPLDGIGKIFTQIMYLCAVYLHVPVNVLRKNELIYYNLKLFCLFDVCVTLCNYLFIKLLYKYLLLIYSYAEIKMEFRQYE